MADRPATDSLYKTEEEIAAIVGVGVDKWREIAPRLERVGAPKRDPLFCGRRYWPGVKAVLDARNGLGDDSHAKALARDGEEHPELL